MDDQERTGTEWIAAERPSGKQTFAFARRGRTFDHPASISAPRRHSASPTAFARDGMKEVHRRFSCSRSPARSRRSHRRVAAGRARAEYRNFLGETPRSFGNRERLGCLNGSIRRSRGEPSRVHVLRTDGWMTIIRPIATKAGRRTEAAVGSIPPDDAVAEAFRRRRRGERPNRVCCRKFRYSAHSHPAATRRRVRRNRRNPRRRARECPVCSGCN